MVIVTESGSQYRIIDGLCKKFDSDGAMVDVFKLWTMKVIQTDKISWEELHEAPEGEPVIGKRLYIAGKDCWWITTPVKLVSKL
jgi:hypothetical protein